MDDNLDDKNSQKLASNFRCEICDYTCNRTNDLNKHLLTLKHKRMTEDDKNSQKLANTIVHSTDGFNCDCGKSYKYRQGLHKHQKKCKYLNNEEEEKKEIVEEKKEEGPDYKELFMQAMKQNNELVTKLTDIIPKIGNNNTTNSNNTTNNTFNLQFFLNETCKDALNITDFIDSLKLQLEDLEYTAENGHVKGITNIFQTALMNMDQTKRPVHCTDLKREVLYIKDNNEWNKDETKDKMKEAVVKVTNKNISNTSKWLDKYPGHGDPSSKDFEKYMKMTSNCMGSNEDTEDNKIVRNIMREVIIDK